MRRILILFSVMAAMILAVGGAALAASQLDQQQTQASSGIGFDANFPMAQTFTAGSSGSLDKVSVHAWLAGSSAAGDMVVSIQTVDGSGFPSGTVLGSGSAPLGDFDTSAPGDWVDVNLTQPARVSAGTQYALVASTASATPEGSSFYVWSMATDDPYPGGDAHGRAPGGQWQVRQDGGVPVDFAFKTFVVPDLTPPRVTGTSPLARATNVAPGSNIQATFSEAMVANTLRNAGTFRSTTFTLDRRNADGTTKRVAARVVYAQTTTDTGAKVYKATLNPDADLQPGQTYVATVTTGARDLAGNALDQKPRVSGNQNMAWTFTVRR
jgi:hypothetical protein